MRAVSSDVSKIFNFDEKSRKSTTHDLLQKVSARKMRIVAVEKHVVKSDAGLDVRIFIILVHKLVLVT